MLIEPDQIDFFHPRYNLSLGFFKLDGSSHEQHLHKDHQLHTCPSDLASVDADVVHGHDTPTDGCARHEHRTSPRPSVVTTFGCCASECRIERSTGGAGRGEKRRRCARIVMGRAATVSNRMYPIWPLKIRCTFWSNCKSSATVPVETNSWKDWSRH